MVSTQRYVLVVDDDPDIVDTLVTLLSMEQYQLRVAHDRDAAWEIVQFGEPDVILLDWFMKGMSLEDFVQKTRSLFPSVQIILLSASATTTDKARELSISHLIKPFDINDVLSAVDRAIQRRQKP
jgi:DNA-binding response OmpR family regulator